MMYVWYGNFDRDWYSMIPGRAGFEKKKKEDTLQPRLIEI